MPVFTLAELTKPVTRAEVQASIYSALDILGVDASTWKPGAVPRVIVVGVSIVLAGFSQLVALGAKSGFLELAEGPWLTAVAHYVYGIDRIEASYATGFVEVSNTSGGEYGLDPSDLIFQNATTGHTYRNLAPVTIAPGPSTVTVAIIATEAGSASTSNAGEITGLTTTLLGITCVNPAPVVGRDAETDPALRTRCSEFLGSLSPFGPWDAYASAARNATRADGASLGIDRFRMVKNGYGDVIITLATPSGEVPPSDLEIAAAAIAEHATPYSVNAILSSAATVPIAIAGEVWLYADDDGPDPVEAEATIVAALRTFVSTRPIGGDRLAADSGSTGHIFVDMIRSAIGGAAPGIFHVVISVPAGDVELTSTQVATLAASPTITIHQVAPPSSFGAT